MVKNQIVTIYFAINAGAIFIEIISPDAYRNVIVFQITVMTLTLTIFNEIFNRFIPITKKMESMKKRSVLKGAILTLTMMLMSSLVWAQGDKASRPSPPQTATGKAGAATITINYSSPAVKGRKIFGGLAQYDKVWRAGANEATIFETDKDIKVEGKTLPAGKYSLYVLLGEKEWTFFFNSEVGQWGIKRGGETTKDAAKDVLSVKVKVNKTASLVERLVYEVTSKGFALKWENSEAMVSVK